MTVVTFKFARHKAILIILKPISAYPMGHLSGGMVVGEGRGEREAGVDEGGREEGKVGREAVGGIGGG